MHFYIIVGHTEHYFRPDGPNAGELYEHTKETEFLRGTDFDFPLGIHEKWEGSDAQEYWLELYGEQKGKGKGRR